MKRRRIKKKKKEQRRENWITLNKAVRKMINEQTRKEYQAREN